MAWVSLDSLDFKYSVPSTDLVSDHLSRFLIPKIWSPYGKCIHRCGKEGFTHPLAKALPSSLGRRGCLSGPPLSLLPCLHSSTFLPVLYLGRGLSKSKDNICFISTFPVHVLNKLEASFQGSVTLCSRNLSEKFGGDIFKLKSLLKSLLNKTRETSTQKRDPASLIFPFRSFSSTQLILSDLLKDLNVQMSFARKNYVLEVDPPVMWDSAHLGHQTEASEEEIHILNLSGMLRVGLAVIEYFTNKNLNCSFSVVS